MDKRTQILDVVRRVAGKEPAVAPDESLFESGVLDSFGLQDGQMVRWLPNLRAGTAVLKLQRS